MQPVIYELPYYIYVLLFGVYVGMKAACGAIGAMEWRVFAGICPALLLIQGLCLQLWDIETVRFLYPLIVHGPTLLAFVFLLKAKWGQALVSIAISYSLCQLLRWIGLVIDAINLAPLPAVIIHLGLCHLLLLLLDRYCLGAIHDIIGSSSRVLDRFGALPLIYYLYEYFMLYTQERYVHILAFNELLPTEMVLFFILFVIEYHREIEKREQAELQATVLEMELSAAEHEMSALRTIQDQTAIHRHDLHHHLMMIDGLLASGQQDQAAAYIRKAESEITAISPIRYCENETINLLLCAFKAKADDRGVSMSIKTALPKTLDLPDTELCAMLSNGLENALNAASLLPEKEDQTIDVYCGIKQNKLLFEIRNPYRGKIAMQDGIPVPENRERRYGCRSIQSIVQRRKGICTFDASGGVFTLRIAIPL